MPTRPDRVYQKSSQGWEELKSRSGRIDAFARTALILLNGKYTLLDVELKLGRSVAPILLTLVKEGLVEPVAGPESKLTLAKPPQKPVPEFESTNAEQLARWNAVRSQVMVRLAPHFGPDLMTVMDPLMNANTKSSFQTVLAALESKLSLYLGRKAAAKLFEDLR